MKRDRTKQNRSSWIFVSQVFCRFPPLALFQRKSRRRRRRREIKGVKGDGDDSNVLESTKLRETRGGLILCSRKTIANYLTGD